MSPKARTAFVDDCLAARDYAPGDVVRKTDFRGFFPSPYSGRVIWSDPRNGTVQVQWPWGSEQESPTELYRDWSGDVAPPLFNQTYETWDGQMLIEAAMVAQGMKPAPKKASLASRVAARYEERTRPVWQAACRAHHSGIGEFDALRELLPRFASEFGPDAVRITVANLYGAHETLGSRIALYWKDTNRRYKVTQREKKSGKLKCPRCSGLRVKPRTYRQGKKVLQCNDCGFSISPKDLIWDNDPPAPAEGAQP